MSQPNYPMRQPRGGSVNPIEQRKQAVRRYSRNAVIFAGGSVALAVVLGLALGDATTVVLVLVVGMILALYNGWQVRRIVNHKDAQ